MYLNKNGETFTCFSSSIIFDILKNMLGDTIYFNDIYVFALYNILTNLTFKVNF